MKADKVYLVGFMGSGKTTVARALAKRLRWELVDIDELIEQQERETVSSVFAKRGEPYFRQVERTVLAGQVSRRFAVVATGGGTFVDPQNRALIKSDGASIWLDVPFERVVGRVPADGRRPLASDRAEFERLYLVRRTAYEEATLRIDAGRSSIGAVVEQVIDWLEAS